MKNASRIFIIIGAVVLACMNIFFQRYMWIRRNTFPYWITANGGGRTCVNKTDKDWLLPSEEKEDSMIVVHPGDTVPYWTGGTYKPWPFPETITVVYDGRIFEVDVWEVPEDSSSGSYVMTGCNGDTAEFFAFNIKGELKGHWKYNLLTDTCIVYETE